MSIIDNMNISTVSLESVSLDSGADASLIEGADSIQDKFFFFLIY